MIIRQRIENIAKQTVNKLGYDITRIETNTRSKIPQIETQGFKELADNYKNYQHIKVHFGCGPRILKGWINIDLIYEPYEKYLQMYTDKYYPEEIRGELLDFYSIDVTKVGLPLPDNSVDIIFHEDFIEHLNQREQIIFLAETLRVLKPGAIHRVNTPNLTSSMKENSNFNKGFVGVFIDEWDKWHHLNILTHTILEEISRMVGYSKVIFNEKDKSISPLIPMEYRPAEDRPDCGGNIFADLIK